MLDQIRRDIQARLDELLGEIDKLRCALAALTSNAGESDRSERAAPAAGAAGESVGKTARRAPRARQPQCRRGHHADARQLSRCSGPRADRAGRDRTAILAALSDGSAMTAGEIAAATGLARATVSSTLSKLATSGEIAKAARGYQLARESDTTRRPARPRPSVGTVATSPSRAGRRRRTRRRARRAARRRADGRATTDSPTRTARRRRPLSTCRPAGATRHAVLAALAGGSAMTAGEVATATGLGRASVSSTLSQLAKAGELRKAARGYQLAGVEPAQRFYFRIEDDVTPRAVVANLPELEAAIAVCGPGVLRHHCAEHDFSRWVAGVFHNEPLAAAIAAAEAQLSADSPTETVEHARLALIAALQARHATQR